MSADTPGSAHASGPVPEHLTVPGWRVGLIVASFTVALPGFLNGAQTGLALGFWPAVFAALLAGIILCAGACLTAIISVRTRLTTYMLVQRSFGSKGSALVNIVIAIVHFCWFGVNVSFFGDAMVAAPRKDTGYRAISAPSWCSAARSSPFPPSSASARWTGWPWWPCRCSVRS